MFTKWGCAPSDLQKHRKNTKGPKKIHSKISCYREISERYRDGIFVCLVTAKRNQDCHPGERRRHCQACKSWHSKRLFCPFLWGHHLKSGIDSPPVIFPSSSPSDDSVAIFYYTLQMQLSNCFNLHRMLTRGTTTASFWNLDFVNGTSNGILVVEDHPHRLETIQHTVTHHQKKNALTQFWRYRYEAFNLHQIIRTIIPVTIKSIKRLN